MLTAADIERGKTVMVSSRTLRSRTTKSDNSRARSKTTPSPSSCW